MKLIDAARVLRSKNAGPLKVTIDLMFDDRAGYERARQSPALSAASVARLYGLDQAQVEVLPYPPAFAIKLVLERRVVAGSPGDSDVYGAQQHGPLLELEL
jgi:predicted metallopeptidase